MSRLVERDELAPPYEEVRLDSFSETFLHNSVLTVPGMMSAEECEKLISAVDSHLGAGGAWHAQEQAYNLTDDGKDSSLKRVRTFELSQDIQELAASIILERVLPFFEQHLPNVALELFAQSSDLADLDIFFSPGEPAINRYTKGGEFKQHRDRFSVTVYVTLSPEDAFTGGGTAFWPQDPAKEEDPEPVVILRPQQGGAVIFNGDVQHSGRVVESGVRHLFVASFHLENPNAPSGPRKWSRCRNGVLELATE